MKRAREGREKEGREREGRERVEEVVCRLGVTKKKGDIILKYLSDSIIVVNYWP